mmetsp:Transcript_54259/g.118802  ORF Transcript_54259/g.118802 Transcript_54259/m.118802 type:complete len:363 (-) Transcript_54259:8-1096(-)
MHPENFAHGSPQLFHLLVGREGEGLRVAAQGLALLLQKLLNELGAAKDFQRRPRSGDGAVVHSPEEGSDQKAHDLLIRDGSAVRIAGVQNGLHKVLLCFVSFRASLVQNGFDHLVDLTARLISFAMSLDGRMGPKDRHRQHAFLKDVQHFHDASFSRLGRSHCNSQLMTHEASDAGSGQQLLHRLSDAAGTVVAPTFIKKLHHFLLQGTGVRADVAISQTLANEAQLTSSRAVVHVVQDLGTKNGDREFVHLGLIQIFVRSKEKFLTFGSHKVNHVHRQEVHLEDAAHLLITQSDEFHWVLQKLNDGTKDWQTHLKTRRFFPRPPPSPQQQGRDDQGGTRRDQALNRLIFRHRHRSTDLSPR